MMARLAAGRQPSHLCRAVPAGSSTTAMRPRQAAARSWRWRLRVQVIEGLDWVRQHYVAPAVVVMALGGEPQYALDMAVRALALSGVPVVVAAGNEDSDACAKSPARSDPPLT